MNQQSRVSYKQRKTIIIETPERVHLTFEIASPLQRAFATIIDLLVIGGAILVLYVIQSLIFSLSVLASGNSSSEFSFESSAWFTSFVVIIIFFIQWGYFAIFEYLLHGRTVGKIAMRLRVIRSNGLNLDFSSSILRNLVRGIDALPSFYLVAAVCSLFDTRHRRLGDIAADTIVIYQPNLKLVKLSKETKLSISKQGSGERILQKLSEDELFVLRRFLNARFGLGAEQRAEFAHKLSTTCVKKTQVLMRPHETDEDYVERIYAGHSNTNA